MKTSDSRNIGTKKYELDLNDLTDKIPEYKSLYDMSETIKSLADPIRLKILYLLKNQELCACYIDSALNKPQSTVAHHLSILKKANILNWRKEGKWTYYSLSNPEIIGMIEEISGEKIANKPIANKSIANKLTTNKSIANKQIPHKNTFKTEIKNQIRDEFFKSFEERAKDLDIFKIGYTKIENITNELTYENVIILAIEMDERIIKTNPGELAKNLNKEFYAKFSKITENLSEYLEIKGFKTEIAYPNEKLLDLPPLGQKAGLGYVGQSGLLITPEFGSKIKLSGILTSIDNSIFNKTANNHKWIKEQCKDCGECIENCESKALVKKDKDYIAELSQSKCIGSKEGCTYCIEKCPFNEKGYLAVKKELLENY
ncbi:MAG: metalloregulator ArsR/SmtB family transcription factor [Methanobrevibacter sp.]|jgi:DNA-binding transcriptional ArsR family regulator/ferredoxin|nr:metalloregulator ArsR/SmtB family transcription factor [Methanobrevibacter sp.]